MSATETTTEKPEPGNGESPSKPPEAKDTEQGGKEDCTCVACQLNAEFDKRGISGKAVVIDVKPGDPMYDAVREGLFGKKPPSEQRLGQVGGSGSALDRARARQAEARQAESASAARHTQEVKNKAFDLLTNMIHANEVGNGVTVAAKDCLQAAELIYG